MKSQGRYSRTEASREKTLEKRESIDEKIESRMRTLANHLIDHVLGIQSQVIGNGLNINKEKDILIMEPQKS